MIWLDFYIIIQGDMTIISRGFSFGVGHLNSQSIINVMLRVKDNEKPAA